MSRESRRGRGKPDAPPAHLARTALLVLGMHRSGTSAMARVLALAGAALPRDLLPPGPGNEAGQWEPARVAGLDDEILAALEAKWHSPFGPRRDGGERAVFDRFLEPARALLREEYGDALLLVLKEPRISLLADFWQEALAAEGVAGIAIIMVRDPAEVAASLAARNGLPVSQGLLLWATYMLAADRLTRDVLRIFCRYDRLLADPEGVLDRVVAATGVALPGRSPEAADATRAFLRPALHHYRLRREGRRRAGAGR